MAKQENQTMTKRVFKASVEQIAQLTLDELNAAIEGRGALGNFVHEETLLAMRAERARRIEQAMMRIGAIAFESVPQEHEQPWQYPVELKG